MAAALAGSGGVFASDPDPELVADALPFSLKLMESVLAENPRHVGLLTGLASGFTQYAYAFLQQKADLLADDDLDGARHLESRARGLYLRARDYALRGLDQSHPGFSKALASAPRDAVLSLRAEDVPLAYWAAASWGAAISVAKDDPLLVGDLAKVEALIDRALDLDKDWGDGAIHGFLIVFEMARATAQGDPVERATRHFERAVELSGGRLASPFVSYAESVCVPTEDRERFVALLERALAVDVNAAPASRVENVVFQRRAEWLLGRVDELFLPPLEPEP
jgi:predicted anti-sigma-YlaC factor YlaD